MWAFRDRYVFDEWALGPGRERARVAIASRWRTAHGLAPIRSPDESPVAEAPDAVLAPLLGAALAATTGAEARDAATAIAAKGVGAVPAVRRALALLREDHPARDALAETARTLAMTVVESSFAPRSPVPPADLAAKAAALVGRAFDAKAFLAVVAETVRRVPDDRAGLLVDVVRGADALGVRIRWEVLVGVAPATDAAWEVRAGLVTGGAEVLPFAARAASAEEVRSGAWAADLEAGLAAAFASPAIPPVRARVLLVPGP